MSSSLSFLAGSSHSLAACNGQISACSSARTGSASRTCPATNCQGGMLVASMSEAHLQMLMAASFMTGSYASKLNSMLSPSLFQNTKSVMFVGKYVSNVHISGSELEYHIACIEHTRLIIIMPVNRNWTLRYFRPCEFTLGNDCSLRTQVDSKFTVPDLFKGIFSFKPTPNIMTFVNLVESYLG